MAAYDGRLTKVCLLRENSRMIRSGKSRCTVGIFFVLFCLANLFLGVNTVMSFDANEVIDEISVIPKPGLMNVRDGEFEIKPTTEIVVDTDDAAKKAGGMLADYFKVATGYELPVRAVENPIGEKNAIILTMHGPSHELGEEGYELDVMDDWIVIKANTYAGFFYGVQTLRQLLPSEIFSREKVDKDIKWTLPMVEIVDVPRFEWRGLMLDEARNFKGKVFAKKLIDTMAMNKMNRLHWHLTDDQGWRIEIKKYPKLTEIGAMRSESPVENDRWVGDGLKYGPYFYTQDEIKEVVAYAKDRNIEIVPEIEMPGHAQAAVAAYPWLGNGEEVETRTRWGISDHIYNVDERTFGFLQDVLTEVIELFPYKYVHIGGDEVPKVEWEESEVAQKVIKREGLKNEAELQGYFVTRIEKFLNAKNKYMIGWDEILESGEVSPTATVMSWRTADRLEMEKGKEEWEGVELGGEIAAKLGHDVIMTPTTYVYLDYYQTDEPREGMPAIGGYLPIEKTYSFEPVPKGLNEEEAKRVLGVQGNIWTEYMARPWQVEWMAWPRGAAIAEIGWSQKPSDASTNASGSSRNFEDFEKRLKKHKKRFDEMRVYYYEPTKVDKAANVTEERKKVSVAGD